jgi:GDP-L-fucose synthase
MRIWLTGGSGMVGSNLRHRLEREHEVLAPMRSELDLLNGEATRQWARSQLPDLVIHAAGKVGGIEANRRDNSGFLWDNTILGFNVVAAADHAGVPRVLNLASSCMYPRLVHGALSEALVMSGPLEPTNEGYAIAKIATMRLCQFTSRDKPGRRYVTAIPCNLYGPGDCFDLDRAHMVPSALRKVDDATRQGAHEVEIWGDGSARREFMYVGDLAEFVAQAVERFESLPDVLNVGLGHDWSVEEYYEAAAATVGYGGEFTHDTSKPVGMDRKLLDTRRVASWGWRPAWTLRDGLSATYDYYRQHVRGALPPGDDFLGRS